MLKRCDALDLLVDGIAGGYRILMRMLTWVVEIVPYVAFFALLACEHTFDERRPVLAGIDVEIPRDKLVVMTGLSGSGKSSLAFDTIYAEGQRRYVESLSAYARQFLGLMEKPDVDYIEGLSPAISIEQKTTSRNPSSRRSISAGAAFTMASRAVKLARLSLSGSAGGLMRASTLMPPPSSAVGLLQMTDGNYERARQLMTEVFDELQTAAPRLEGTHEPLDTQQPTARNRRRGWRSPPARPAPPRPW